MRGVNKAILLGRVGQDPKVTGAVTSVSLATSESWKDKESGEKVEKTEWHNVVFFGKLADIARQYVHKGSLIYVEGKISTSKYQDKTTGQDKYSTKVIADNIQLLDSRKEEAPKEQAKLPVDDFDCQDIPF